MSNLDDTIESLLCRQCGKDTVAPSKRRKRWDGVMRIFGRVPVRCQRCGFRFFVPAKVVRAHEKHEK